jgi:YHS domain-containing protein
MPKSQENIPRCSEEPTMVCGRNITVDPSYIPQTTFKGTTYYFCTETCLNAFLADPERFYCAHSQPASIKTHQPS